MKKKYFTFTALLCGVFTYTTSMAQLTLSGSVISAETKESLIGVNIVVKGTSIGTATDVNGRYKLNIKGELPLTVSYSAIGFNTLEKRITTGNISDNIDVALSSATLLGQEVVISASRVEENILQSPVTVEKLDILSIQQAATPDFYDKLVNVKGVNVIAGSLTFTSINTRGFATNANTRFVQLVDWVDNAAPVLNFPTGNLVGLSELEVESVELIPGAASALYGPNAFNGILLMNSKNPFDYEGLSVQVKTGVTQQNARATAGNATTSPLYNVSLRYAKKIGDKLAFKIHGSILDAKDWESNVYDIESSNPSQRVDVNDENFTGRNPDFNGLNLYGDDIPIDLPINTTFADLVEAGSIPQLAGLSAAQRLTLANGMRELDNPTVTRTGFREQDLFADYNARSIKIGGALHYKISDKLEVNGSYTYGSGSSIYQGAQKYAIRNFLQDFFKLELVADNFFVRGYVTRTDAGNSYNVDALGAFANEAFSPSSTEWAGSYGLTYAAARLGVLGLIDPNFTTQLGNQFDEATSHRIARAAADAAIPETTSQAFQDTLASVRSRFFKIDPNGASFIDNSRIYHGEFNYNFKNQIKFIDLQIGGNYRQYDLSSGGTIYKQESVAGEFQRIPINEYGIYTQVIKKLLDNRLKLTGSLRYDKNENFQGQISPRVSGVYTFATTNNIRVSYQTGFRNPDSQAQFIDFPTATGRILGGTPGNAQGLAVYETPVVNALTMASNLANGISPDTITIDYVKPEKVRVIEVGYKSVINNTISIDVNYYNNRYTDFIVSGAVIPIEGEFAGSTILPYTNASDIVNSQGAALGLQYNAPKDFVFSGNYSWNKFSAPDEVTDATLLSFNTPEHSFNLGLANRRLFENFGFDISYHWQQEFKWVSTFAPTGAHLPSYHLLNAQINYEIPSMKTVLKLGGTNLLRKDYFTAYGGPAVGSQFYFSITFDQSMR